MMSYKLSARLRGVQRYPSGADCALSFAATGLYYIAELVEEYTRLTKRIIATAIKVGIWATKFTVAGRANRWHPSLQVHIWRMDILEAG
jgi:hypothetical protein